MKKLTLNLLFVALIGFLCTSTAYAGIPIEGTPVASEVVTPVAQTKKVTKLEKRILKKLDKKLKKSPAAGGKSQLIAAILCFFVGFLGVHRFYLGYTWQGVVQLLTGGGLGIWVLIDFIRILIGDLGPKDGAYDKTL